MMTSAKSKAVPFGVSSDAGRVRQNNEDNFLAAPELGLFVVSDGMGGAASGEVASRLTVETVVAHCREAEADPTLPLCGDRMSGASEIGNRLVSAIRLANRKVYEAARANQSHHGMGATVVAIRCAGQRMSVAHAGDSRVYRLRGKELEPLTRDHSFIAEQLRRGMISEAEAARTKLGNVLVRAVGLEPDLDVELDEQLCLEGDVVLLCSDGLTNEVGDAEIAEVLQSAKHMQDASQELVKRAIENGGSDNVTALVLRPIPKAAAAFARIGELGRSLFAWRYSN